MQAKAKLWGDHHGLSLLRLLRDELSLPVCLFPTSLAGLGLGCLGELKVSHTPVQGRRDLPLALPACSRTVERACCKRANYSVSLQTHRMSVFHQCPGAMIWPGKF